MISEGAGWLIGAPALALNPGLGVGVKLFVDAWVGSRLDYLVDKYNIREGFSQWLKSQADNFMEGLSEWSEYLETREDIYRVPTPTETTTTLTPTPSPIEGAESTTHDTTPTQTPTPSSTGIETEPPIVTQIPTPTPDPSDG